MKKLAQIAEAHYNAAPKAIRKMADDFFWSMVKKGNRSVKQDDFLASMKKKGYTEYAKPEFFQLLLKDGNQDLSIFEGRTLFYILVSRRPFCSWCNCFIPDIFFCCSKCPASSYSLCLHCYTAKAYVRHNHYGDHDAFFLDYTVLHNCIQTSPTKLKKQKTGLKIGKDTLSTITAILGAWAATLTIGSTCCTIM
nr:Ca2+ sensor (EF-Hand superfamily) [Ipomoea batatas]